METQDQRHRAEYSFGLHAYRKIYGPIDECCEQRSRRAKRRWLAKVSRKIAAKGGIPHEQK